MSLTFIHKSLSKPVWQAESAAANSVLFIVINFSFIIVVFRKLTCFSSSSLSRCGRVWAEPKHLSEWELRKHERILHLSLWPGILCTQGNHRLHRWAKQTPLRKVCGQWLNRGLMPIKGRRRGVWKQIEKKESEVRNEWMQGECLVNQKQL